MQLATLIAVLAALFSATTASPLQERQLEQRAKAGAIGGGGVLPGRQPSKFPGFKLPNLGKSGANFPRNDPNGLQRLSRAGQLTTAWRQKQKKTGGLKLAGFSSWDLSNVNGKNYITSIKDQGDCGSCVSFSTTGALESTLLYKAPNYFATSSALASIPDLSEQYLYFCLGKRGCNDGWWIDTGVLTAASGGAYDEQCLPYNTASTSCTLSCGASQNWGTNGTGTIGTVKLDTWEDIRSHIVNNGPISTGFTVYSDFPGFQDSSFYTFSSSYVWPGTKTNKILGGHAVMCYGFDDNMLNGQTSTSTGVLFCKNSWGTGWGASGFFKIAYGADGIMSGLGDTYGFSFTPATVQTTDVPTGTSPAPAPTNTDPVVVTTVDPGVVTTEPPAPPAPTTPPPAPVVTTPAPVVATTARPVRTTYVPQPVRGVQAAACQNQKLKISCSSIKGTYLNVTYAFYGRDVTGVNGDAYGGCYKRGYDTTTRCGVDQTALWSVCSGYKSCYAKVNDWNLGSSGCPAKRPPIWKLARVTYDCLPASAFTAKFGIKFKPHENEGVAGKPDDGKDH